MAFIIGIDPGKKHTGMCCITTTPALILNCNILGIDLSSTPNDRNIDEAINWHIGSAGSFTGWLSSQYYLRRANTVVVIEKPVVYPNDPRRVSDIMDLMRIAGNIEGYMRKSGQLTVTVEPAVWKGQVPKKVHNQRVLESAPGLAEYLKKYPKSHHEHIIDAYGIAAWYAEKGRI